MHELDAHEGEKWITSSSGSLLGRISKKSTAMWTCLSAYASTTTHQPCECVFPWYYYPKSWDKVGIQNAHSPW